MIPKWAKFAAITALVMHHSSIKYFAKSPRPHNFWKHHQTCLCKTQLVGSLYKSPFKPKGKKIYYNKSKIEASRAIIKSLKCVPTVPHNHARKVELHWLKVQAVEESSTYTKLGIRQLGTEAFPEMPW